MSLKQTKMVKADSYFLSLLLRNYKGQSLIFYLINDTSFTGTIGDLSRDHGLVEVTDEVLTQRFISLCDIVGLQSTTTIPIVLPHRSRKCYAKIDSNLGSCSKAMNSKVFEFWKSQALINAVSSGLTIRNTRISDVVPGLFSLGVTVFVTSQIVELQVPTNLVP